ncbi:MAG: InlB B-repeat-containing protein [Acholeplasmatales bacterium]|nr:InlB B-repeat-containing protein [Acholeplasmatales bacterium]
MNKFKKVMLGALSVLTLGLFAVIGTRVDAADTSVFNANNGTDATDVAKNTNFISDSILQIQAKGAKATFGADYALGDYDLGLWFSNNTTSTKGFYFTNTSSTESIELTVVFGAFNSKTAVAVSSYFTTDTSNTVTTSTTDPVSLTTNLEAGTSSYLVTTGRQTSLFEVSYSTGAVYYDVTLNDNGVETVKSVKSGEKLVALDDMYGYTFAGYYLDEDFTEEFDYANETVTSELNLFVKWASNGYFTNDYKLTTSCISPFATEIGSSTAIASDIKLNHIYTALSGCKGYTSGNGAIVTNGGLATTQKGLKIDLSRASAGMLVVNISCGGNSKRSAKLVNSSNTSISAYSGDVDWPDDSTDWYTSRTITYSIETAGVYYLGGDNSMRIFDVEFIPESVTPLVQKATDSTYTYVRFVTIIKGVEEIDATDVSFSVTMTYASDSSEKTVNYTPYVVKKITQNNDTYTATVGSATHTFDNSVNPTEYYVVYVLRLTTSKFSGNSVKATTTFGGTPYVSDSETI